MLGSFLKSGLGWIAAAFATKPTRPIRHRHRYRPFVETMEELVLPATYNWTPVANGDYNASTAQNWTDPFNNHAVPTATDKMVFSAANNQRCTIDGGFQGTVDQIDIQAGYSQQITLQTNLTVRETNQDGGVIFGSYSFIVPSGGLYNWNAGTLRGFGGPSSYLTTIQTGGQLNINAPTAALDGRTIQNNGITVWNGAVGQTRTMAITNGGSFQQFGTFAIPAGGTYDVNTGTDGFNNSAMVQVANAATLNFFGTLNVSSTGKFSLPAAGSVMAVYGTANVSGGSEFFGQGRAHFFSTLNVTSGTATVNCEFITEAGSTVNVGGVLDVISGTLRVRGTSFNGVKTHIANGSRLFVEGDLNLGGNFSLVNDGDALWSAGVITLNGTATVTNNRGFMVRGQADLVMGGSGSFVESNVAGNEFIVDQGANRVSINVTFTNAGQLTLFTGTLRFPGSWTQTAGGTTDFTGGRLEVGGTFTIAGTVRVAADATIAATLVQNNGRINLQNGVPQILSIIRFPGATGGGNYTQGGTGVLLLEITGDNANDALSIAGTATFGGTLNVALSGYQPQGPNARTWPLITYTQRNNQFATPIVPPGFGLPGYGAQTMTVTWSPN